MLQLSEEELDEVIDWVAMGVDPADAPPAMTVREALKRIDEAAGVVRWRGPGHLTDADLKRDWSVPREPPDSTVRTNAGS